MMLPSIAATLNLLIDLIAYILVQDVDVNFALIAPGAGSCHLQIVGNSNSACQFTAPP